MHQLASSAKILSDIPSAYDLSLPDWGPYGKEYVGLSHIADLEAGHRWGYDAMTWVTDNAMTWVTR